MLNMATFARMQYAKAISACVVLNRGKPKGIKQLEKCMILMIQMANAKQTIK